MIKLIEIIKRREDKTHEEFIRYWEDIHGPKIASAIPGLRKYVQNKPVILAKGTEPPIDGIAELWFDDLESWRRSAEYFLGDEGIAVRHDAEEFVDRKKLVVLVCEEKVVKDF